MQKMSGADLGLVLAELALLQGKRIAKIRRTQEGIFIFKIGSEELLFQPGVRLHLTRQALQATDAPDGFVGFLRKALEGKTAQEIKQVQGERIVEITTRSKERLVFELFRKGNLILVGEDSHRASHDGAPLPAGKEGGNIYACLLHDEAGGRKVARGEKYEYPKAQPYAAKVPSEVAFSVKENEKGEPTGFSYDASQAGRKFATFCEALDYYYANQREESDGQKAAAGRMEKLRERLESQEGALARIEAERLEARKAADEISADFERLEGLLALVRKMKKDGASEEEINRAVAAQKARVEGAQLQVGP